METSGNVLTVLTMTAFFRKWKHFQRYTGLAEGIIDGGTKMFPQEGQGGVISPLLSNIALHGMEEMLLEWIETIPKRILEVQRYQRRPAEAE
jgi:hypothetical protein